MLPMGWNQIRQARVSGMNQQQPPQQMPYGQMVPNQQPFNIYRPPAPVMPPHQSHVYPPHPMIGNFGMPNPQMMMQQQQQQHSGKPPEPDGPPPPSPPAPLPTSDPAPPPPPDDNQWWVAEMKNLPSDHHRQELERMVNEKWFHTMNTSQQIECWQHKLHLINKQKKGNPNQIDPSPDVTAPTPTSKPVYQAAPQLSNLEIDLKKAREEESSLRQQVVTFEKQYGDWKKQFDDWKDKHKSHPNKEQFVQYENQWMTWQQQMSDQRKDFENNLNSVLDRIRHLEQKKIMTQNPPNPAQMQNSGPIYPGNAPNQNFFTPQAQAAPRFSQANQSFNRNSQYQEENFQQQNPPRFPLNNPNLGNTNQGFGQRIPGQANLQRPPIPGRSQNRPDQNRPNNSNPSRNDNWQSDQFHDKSDDYADEYHENNWGDKYQDHGVYNENDNNYYKQDQDYSNYGGDDGWDQSLSLLPGQASNRFDGHDRRRPQRYPNPRFGARNATDPRFRGPRPRGFGQDPASRLPHPPSHTHPAKPLMDIQIRAPRPALQGLNSKLMSLSTESLSSDKMKRQKLDSQNLDKSGLGGMRGMGARGPRPTNVRGGPHHPRALRPTLEQKKPFPSNQNRFPHPKNYSGQQREGTLFRGAKQVNNENDSLEDQGGKGMEKADGIKAEKSESKMSQEPATKAEQPDFADDSIPDDNAFFISGPGKIERQDSDPKGEVKRVKSSDSGSFSKITQESGNDAATKLSEQSRNNLALGKSKGDRKGNDAEDDYSHYFTDEYTMKPQKNVKKEPPHEQEPPHGRDLLRGRGRPLHRGIGRGNAPIGLGRRRYFDDELFLDDWDMMGRYPRELPIQEELYYERLRERELLRQKDILRDIPSERKMVIPKQHMEDSLPVNSTSEKSEVDAKTIMEKAKALSNIDVENLLSAVKSIKSSSATIEDVTKSNVAAPPAMGHTGAVDDELASSSTRIKDKETAAILAQEQHYEQLAKKYDSALLRCRNEDRLLEEEILAATSLGLRDDDRLIDDYLGGPMRDRLRDPLLRRNLLDPLRERHALREPAVRDPLLDPLLRESYLEKEMLIREIREMREREEQRQKEESRREMELMEALTKPIVQAQKIVETIDYSHGMKKEEGKDEAGKRSPHFDCPRPERERMFREGMRARPPMMERIVYDHGHPDPVRRPPDIPPGMRRPDMPPRFPMHDRMMEDRRRFEHWAPPYDPNSSIVVADDVIQNSDALQKHWDLLDRERESVERRRHSMERRRSSLERSRQSREREEERRDRERSLERLRRMERELKERERMLNDREMRLKSPPRRRARDTRSRSDWKPEGANRRSRSPIRRRSQERRFQSRSRSISPRRRSLERGRDKSPIRGRRRFTSPSGESKQRPPMPRIVKLEPVCVRVEDLLNDPARQQRPKRIVIILRGLPGSGKSHIAKLIRDHETARGVTPRVLGLDDYFMVENEKFEKDPDTQKIVKRKVHEYEYDAAMETSYRGSLFKAFKKTLEDGYFNFVIIDCINDQVSHFADFWTTAKKNFFEVYVAELLADAHVCAKRNIHKRALDEIQRLALSWEDTPQHMIRLDVKQMLQDSEIQEVEMGDVSDDGDAEDNSKKEKMTLEQLAGIPQSKWELMEANERLDKLDGIKKKKLTSSQQDMAEFLSVTDDYVQRSSAPGKKRVRWADIAEKSEQQRLREVGFVVGKTDWSRLVDGDSHADAALNRTKFI